MDEPTPPHIDVVAGIVVDDDDRVLIAKRPEHLDQGGLWEFPGGKREAHENSAQALARELYEELDIIVERSLPAIALTHQYPNKVVNLRFFEISKWSGKPRGKEGQPIRWVTKSQLEQFSFPAANVPVLSALRFPRVILRFSSLIDSTEELNKLEHCLASGFKTIVFATPRPIRTEYQQCQNIQRLCEKYGAQLILDCHQEMLVDFPNSGLYLSAARLGHFRQRPVSHNQLLVCEIRSLEDFDLAARLEPNALFLSLACIENLKRLEKTDDFREFSRQFNFPLMALSNSSADVLCDALNMGCYGIAVTLSDWRSITFDSIDSYFEQINASLSAFPNNGVSEH